MSFRPVFIGNSQIDRMNAGTIDAMKMDAIRIYSIPLRNLPLRRD